MAEFLEEKEYKFEQFGSYPFICTQSQAFQLALDSGTKSVCRIARTDGEGRKYLYMKGKFSDDIFLMSHSHSHLGCFWSAPNSNIREV